MLITDVCYVPGCKRQNASAALKGRSRIYCRYHVQFRARHGSHWHSTFRADELKPYVVVATQWIAQRGTNPVVLGALADLEFELAFAGPIDPNPTPRGQSVAYRARVAFARLREAKIEARRLFAIYLGVASLIEDDRGSHRTREFQLVQAAKAVHRLASGTHRRWEMWNPVGDPVRTELHAYPRSSGLVLRKIGERLEKAAGGLATKAVPEIVEIKTARFGPHPSHLPGWQPAWAHGNSAA